MDCAYNEVHAAGGHPKRRSLKAVRAFATGCAVFLVRWQTIAGAAKKHARSAGPDLHVSAALGALDVGLRRVVGPHPAVFRRGSVEASAQLTVIMFEPISPRP